MPQTSRGSKFLANVRKGDLRGARRIGDDGGVRYALNTASGEVRGRHRRATGCRWSFSRSARRALSRQNDSSWSLLKHTYDGLKLLPSGRRIRRPCCSCVGCVAGCAATCKSCENHVECWNQFSEWAHDRDPHSILSTLQLWGRARSGLSAPAPSASWPRRQSHCNSHIWAARRAVRSASPSACARWAWARSPGSGGKGPPLAQQSVALPVSWRTTSACGFAPLTGT